MFTLEVVMAQITVAELIRLRDQTVMNAIFNVFQERTQGRIKPDVLQSLIELGVQNGGTLWAETLLPHLTEDDPARAKIILDTILTL